MVAEKAILIGKRLFSVSLFRDICTKHWLQNAAGISRPFLLFPVIKFSHWLRPDWSSAPSRKKQSNVSMAVQKLCFSSCLAIQEGIVMVLPRGSVMVVRWFLGGFSCAYSWGTQHWHSLTLTFDSKYISLSWFLGRTRRSYERVLSTAYWYRWSGEIEMRPSLVKMGNGHWSTVLWSWSDKKDRWRFICLAVRSDRMVSTNKSRWENHEETRSRHHELVSEIPTVYAEPTWYCSPRILIGRYRVTRCDVVRHAYSYEWVHLGFPTICYQGFLICTPRTMTDIPFECDVLG